MPPFRTQSPQTDAADLPTQVESMRLFLAHLLRERMQQIRGGNGPASNQDTTPRVAPDLVDDLFGGR